MRLIFACIAVILSAVPAISQTAPAPAASRDIPLVLEAGVPLRLYLSKRLPKRAGEQVQAKVLEPLFAFDRIVVPAGSDVQGTVRRLDPAPKMKRAKAMLGGDFTPLHEAEVEFTMLVLAGGRRIPLHTVESTGLNTIVPLHPPKARKPQRANGGLLGTGKQKAREQMDAARERVRGVADMVRGPDKKELLQEYLLTKLPYHPQWVRNRTRFDAELAEPVSFGTVPVANDALSRMGTQPPADSIAHVRFLTGLDSASATPGDKVEAVVTQPVFSSDHKLILPEGTRLTGAVTVAHAARWFHRSGRLRFSFQNVELPAYARQGPGIEFQESRTQAMVESVESGGKANLKVDSEGGVKATESKTRFIAPVVSFLVASRAADNDRTRTGAEESNVGGRTTGGASGFGLLGAAAAQSSRTLGAALGFYGLAWSVYANIVARGGEVEFGKNAAMDIRFGARPRLPAAKTPASAPVAAAR